ncbi:MAG: CHAT domain-containing tetratricopeptide repeat protein [Cyanobacteria bacterium P01_H01_bin.15]
MLAQRVMSSGFWVTLSSCLLLGQPFVNAQPAPLNAELFNRCTTGWVSQLRIGLSACEELLKEAQTTNDQALEIRALLNMGRIFRTDGQFTRAETKLQQALDLSQTPSSAANDLTPSVQDFLGSTPVLQQAEAQFEQFQQSRSAGAQTEIWLELGFVRLAVQKDAETPFQIAIVLSETDPFAQASVYNEIGLAYRQQGEIARAYEYFELRDHTFGATTPEDHQLRQANYFVEIGQPAQAIPLYQQLIASDHGSKELYFDLGLAYAAAGQYQEALKAFKKTDKTLYQGQVLIELEQFAQAESVLTKAVYDAEKRLTNLERDRKKTNQRQQAQLNQQQQITEQVLEQMAVNLPPDAARALRESFQQGAAQIQQDFTQTQQSTLVYEDQLAVGLRESQSAAAYDLLLRTQIAQGKVAEALTVAEQSRGRVFRRQLAQRTGQELPAQPLTAPDIQSIADREQRTFVIYAVVNRYDFPQVKTPQPDKLYIWVVSPGRALTFKEMSLNRVPLNSLLEQVYYLASIGETFSAELRQLYRLLIEPIEANLPPTGSELTIVPDEGLFLVPFAALKTADTYLIENYPLAISPVLSNRTTARSQTTQGALIVGNPTMPFRGQDLGDPPEQLSSLSGAETEAKIIANLLATKPLIGRDATETEIKRRLASAQVIHLATHGEFDARDGLDSWVAFSPGPQEDGFLTAAELLQNRQLAAELVVLSACVTGRGPVTGDGVIGLSRSFLAAGAESLVASLWYVPDAGTEVLMTKFYEYWQGGNDKAQALRLAMKDMINSAEFSTPDNWAGFLFYDAPN